MKAINSREELWVLEYSESEHKAGCYPLHIDLKKNSDRHGPGPGRWKVIAIGSAKEIYDACEKKHNELSLKNDL